MDASEVQESVVSQTMHHLAVLHRRRGEGATAERLLQEAVALERAVLPPDHPLTAEILTSLGAVLTELGRPGEAEPLLREALDIRRAKHGDQARRHRCSWTAIGA